VTVWVKRMDVAGARYVDLENVDLEQTVSKFIARWVAQAKLDVDPSLVSLRLVKCGARKPSAEEEKLAVELDDPRLSLAEAGITDGCSLLAFVASSAPRSPCTVSNYISDSGTPRSGPPLPEDLVAARVQALMDLDAGVQQMQQYTVSLVQVLDVELPVPRYVTVPPHASLQYSARERFVLDNGSGRFTFMRRQLSRTLKDRLVHLLGSRKPAAYIQGPQGVGKSHLLYEAAVLLSLTPGCRVVYEHDCASWATYANKPIEATLYWIRAVAMGFSGDAPVVALCKEFTEKVAVMKDPADAESAVRNLFLPHLGVLCARLKLKVFFVFDQHNSLTPEMRKTFPYSLPEAGLLYVSQLRGVGMVVISASANNEYFLDVAMKQPPWPMFPLNTGFSPSEVTLFLQRHGWDVPATEEAQLQYETNGFPLELAYLVQARSLLRDAGRDYSFEAVLNAYLYGRDMAMMEGRRDYFALVVRHFDQKLESEAARKQVINGVICLQLQLPASALPGQVILNRQLSFLSDRPFGSTVTSGSGSLDYIHPITPMARAAAVNFYLTDPEYTAAFQLAFNQVFTSPTLEPAVRGLMLQRYIIQQLRLSTSFDLFAQQYTAGHALTRVAALCRSRIPLRCVEWFGNDVPPATVSRTEDLLLVPLSPNYPGVDFLVWKADVAGLFLFQVTMSSVAKHRSNFWQGDLDLERRWIGKLGVKMIERIWITPDVDAGPITDKRSHVGQWVCSLGLVARKHTALFPLVQNWLPESQLGTPRKRQTKKVDLGP
jgi:hypothetical protein